MCEGASKQILNLKILARRDRAGTAPPRFEIPGSATDQHHNQIVLCCESQKYSDIHTYLVPKIQFEMESDVNIEPV